MTDDRPLTDEERRLQQLLRLWTVLFGVGAASFAAQPDRTLRSFPGETPPQGDRFWNALAVSLMATITALSAAAAADVRGRRDLLRPLMLSKAVSSSMFLARWARRPRQVAHLAGAVCDGSILAVTWVVARSASRA